MPMRKYYLVGDGTAINMRQKLARERAIRSVSITSNGENVGDIKSGYVCEVRKSPRAPEYEVHYVKTKRDGIKMIRSRKNPVPKSTDSIPTHSTDYDSKTESEITDKEKETDDMVGLRVIACNKQDGLYYPGSVDHTAEATYAVVNFNNKKRQKVRTQMIIPMSGAIPRPELAPGDFVLVRVFNQSLQSECYVPAIVEVTPEDARHHAKFYSVLLYNGQRETTMRKFIVKIGKARFEMAIRYIAHIQQQKILRQESALSENSSMPSPQSQSSKRSEDDASSTRSSQSGRGRRKKEKITKKLVVKKEKTETQKKKRKSKSRSRSRSRSRSQSSKSSRSRSRSSSRSSSRSRSQSSRSQSERSRSRSGSSRSRSRSRSGSSRSRSRSSSQSYSSRSRSGSSRSSERSGRSRERLSRSRSRSSSSSTVRSRSSVQRSKSTVPPRSRTSSKSSRSRSRSRDSDRSKGSQTPRAQSPYDRPHRPTPTACRKAPIVRTDSMLDSETITRKDIYNERRSRQSFTSETSKMVNVDEKDEMIQALQYQLEKQKRKQLRQERRLVRQARKINKISRKIKESDTSHNESGQSSHSDRTDKARNRRSSTSSSEEDMSPQRRNGSPDGTSYGESPDIQQRSSPGLRVNQEVLARWNDDGWYYRGSVMVEGKDNKYIIRDSTGYMETISREDILTESEHKFDAIQPEDHVIGLHPKYVFSYAPAEVLGTYSNSTIKVEFFDGNIAKLTEEEVYKIPKAKYNQVIEYIKKCEKNLIGRSVVAREDVTGLYKLAVVDSRVGLGQQYYLKWLDGDMSKQNANHIFEVGKKQTRHEDWSHVLAPISQHSMTFMPAEVIDTNPLVVQFCNGKRSTDATFDQCFWLSKDYYNNARGYLMEMKYQNIRESHSDRNGE